MAHDELALHAWLPGQLLTPAHFQHQERVLLAHMARRFRLCGGPAYGIAALSLDEEALAAGVVDIQHLQWVLRDGTLIETRGNAGGVQSVQLDGFGMVAVHLCALPPRPAPVASEASEVVPQHYRLHLVCGDPPWPHELADGEPLAEGRYESVQILQLKRSADGTRFTRTDYTPPVLQVGSSPYLLAELASLAQCVRAYNRDWQATVAKARAMRADGVNAQRLLVQGQRLLALLAESLVGILPAEEGQVPPHVAVPLHPYALFSAIRDYATELAAQPGSVVRPDLLTYDHEDIAGSFRTLFSAVYGGAPATPSVQEGIAFEREARLFVARNLPVELLGDRELVLAVRGEANLAQLKLASPSRIGRVHSFALPGIRVQPTVALDASPGAADTRYYALQVSREEWQYVRRERALCFQRVPGAQLQVALMWRRPRGLA